MSAYVCDLKKRLNKESMDKCLFELLFLRRTAIYISIVRVLRIVSYLRTQKLLYVL